MNNKEISNKWEKAAQDLEADPMRPIRYGMGLRYLKDLNRNISILDAGCGEGTGLKFYKRYGFHNLIGTDVSSNRIESAKNKLLSSTMEGIEIIKNELDSKLPFEDDCFDVVMSYGVIEHTLNPFEFLSELRRVTKKNGKIILSSDCYTWLILKYIGLYKTVQPVDKPLTLSQFRKLFRNLDLNLLHFDTFHHPTQKCFIFDSFFRGHFGLKRIPYPKNEYKQFLKISNKSERLKPYSKVVATLLNYFDNENIFLLEKN